MTTDYGTAPAPAPRSAKTNGLAIGALVCGVLSLFACCIPEVGAFVSIGLGIVAVVLGYMAVGQINRTGEQGRGMAIAGAVIGGIVAAVLIVLLILALIFGVVWLQQIQQQGPGFGQPAEEIIIEDDELGPAEDIVPEPGVDESVEPVEPETETDVVEPEPVTE